MSSRVALPHDLVHALSGRPASVPANIIRVGKPRAHKEGISLDIFHDLTTDSILLATAYGADESEARYRAGIAAQAFGQHYGCKVQV